jgi:DUF4097 and DUF4098 domain-containing protein YvlB
MRRLPIAALVFALAFTAQAAQQKTHRTFNVAPGGKLVLTADVGDVKVTTGGSGVTVDVVADASESVLKEHRVDFRQDGNTLYVDGDYNNHGWNFFDWNHLRVHYTIQVPSQFNLDVKTSGGDLDIGDLSGEILARTSGGDVEMGRTAGTVDVKTSGGEVKIRSASGKLIAVSSGGDIEIEEAGGPVEARTSGGSIEITRAGGNVLARSSGGGIRIGEALGAVDATTSGGSITARISRQPNADSRLVSSGGGINVSLAGDVRADLEAHTSGGGIDSNVPVTVLGKQSENDLVGKINGGGPRLVVRTSGGGITLKRQ